ncbi:hypothetical protein ACIHDR_04055 [Nocardia sp. NPDC052278]|uniref:hypothetical protein n=1 Tax=unclassified Nocardia TaxID=2637762 RepID=UPI0036B99B50
MLDADAERLSAFIRAHIGIDGHYAFHLPDLGGATASCVIPMLETTINVCGR